MSQRKNEVKLISSSTILILSGVVLGIAFSQFIGAELLPYLVAVGLSGVLVYVVLDIAASRRDLEELAAEREQVEERLDKHMFSISKTGFTLPPANSSDDVEFIEMESAEDESKPDSQLVSSA